MRQARYYIELGKLTYWINAREQGTRWGMGEKEARAWIKELIVANEVVQGFEVVLNSQI